MVHGADVPPPDKPNEPIQPFVQRVDGSGRTPLPGFPLTSAGLIRDRFAVLSPPAVTGGTRAGDHVGAWLYDRCADKSGLVVFPDRDKAADAWRELRYGAATSEGPILFWETAGDSYTVPDLSRIPDATCAG